MEALLHVLVHRWPEDLMTWREEEGRGKKEQGVRFKKWKMKGRWNSCNTQKRGM